MFGLLKQKNGGHGEEEGTNDVLPLVTKTTGRLWQRSPLLRIVYNIITALEQERVR